MPTSIIRIALSSKDIVSDAISLSDTQKITSNGSAGLDLTTGLKRQKLQASAAVVIVDEDDYATKSESQLAYIYIKNFSSNLTNPVFTDSVKILVSDGSSTHLTLGHLPGGHAVILPYSANNDIQLHADTNDTIVEHILIHA